MWNLITHPLPNYNESLLNLALPLDDKAVVHLLPNFDEREWYHDIFV